MPALPGEIDDEPAGGTEGRSQPFHLQPPPGTDGGQACKKEQMRAIFISRRGICELRILPFLPCGREPSNPTVM